MQMMRKKSLIRCVVLLAVSSLFLMGCGESETTKAQRLLNEAQKDYAVGNLQGAQILIDSLHSSFPKLVSYRRSADTLSWRIAIVESSRNCVYLDSMYSLKQTELEPMLKGFILEKDGQYQDIGNYVSKELRTERNTERCYLKPFVNEHGEFFLMSYYVGSSIDYNQLKVTVGDMFAETGVADASDIHAYDDMGVKHETVMFIPEVLGSVPEFMYEHSTERLRVTLIGKKSYIYHLNELERKLYAQTYALSIVLSDIYKLDQELNKNKARYILNEQRLNGDK